MSLEYRIGDVFDRLAEIPDGSIDLIVTSPPFLALRSYLPADHPDKHREIGSEATPADFLDTLLALSAEWGRVLAPHGSLCVELGDTYTGGALGFTTGDKTWRPNSEHADGRWSGREKQGAGWPLPKSRTMIDTLYPACLAYNRNLLTGRPSPAGQWRIRNLIVWARPNPPVGALGDKFRPATSYITVACRGVRRYFDLDAVREPGTSYDRPEGERKGRSIHGLAEGWTADATLTHHPAGAPPLDWHTDHHPEDGDWLWKMSTQPYSGSHYATFPMALPKRLIEAMCPLKVCTICGRPSERIVDAQRINPTDDSGRDPMANVARLGQKHAPEIGWEYDRTTVGWSDCGCVPPPCPEFVPEWGEVHGGKCSNCPPRWRTGIVLDPFAGSGTTLDAAQAVGRHAIGIDLDPRNADLARDRVGMFLDVVA